MFSGGSKGNIWKKSVNNDNKHPNWLKKIDLMM